MIRIDGSQGEGGGQVLRTSLSLSLVTGIPFQMFRVRAGRKRPGLLRQHLAAVRAATSIGRAEVSGDALQSGELTFRPTGIFSGFHHVAVGSAGSATLVLQTVLPALLRADAPSELVLEGGTHNPMAPPFPFLQRAFLPLLERIGMHVSATLERPGFYPAGGGRLRVRVAPHGELHPLALSARGEVQSVELTAIVAKLPRHVAERELATARVALHDWPVRTSIDEVRDSQGPGNALLAEIRGAEATELFSAFGQKGLPAERVADALARETLRFLRADVPVGEHLADQLLLPMVLARGGQFQTCSPSLHFRTQVDVLKRFLDVDVRVHELAPDRWQVETGHVELEHGAPSA